MSESNDVVEINTDGRTDVDEFFRHNGFRENSKLNHNPFLVFESGQAVVNVRIVDRAQELLSFADETKVMAQWKGHWQSDFFQFTVGQFRRFVETTPKQPYDVF